MHLRLSDTCWGVTGSSGRSQSGGARRGAQTGRADGRSIGLQPPCGEPHRALTLLAVFLAARLAAGFACASATACRDTASSELLFFLEIKKPSFYWGRKAKGLLVGKSSMCKREVGADAKFESNWCPLHKKRTQKAPHKYLHSTQHCLQRLCVFLFLHKESSVHVGVLEWFRCWIGGNINNVLGSIGRLAGSSCCLRARARKGSERRLMLTRGLY